MNLSSPCNTLRRRRCEPFDSFERFGRSEHDNSHDNKHVSCHVDGGAVMGGEAMTKEEWKAAMCRVNHVGATRIMFCTIAFSEKHPPEVREFCFRTALGMTKDEFEAAYQALVDAGLAEMTWRH